MKTLKRHIAIIFCLLVVFCGHLNAAEDILPNISPEQKAMMEAALTSFGLLDEYQNYVDDLSKLINKGKLENLPMGISRTISNVEYTELILHGGFDKEEAFKRCVTIIYMTIKKFQQNLTLQKIVHIERIPNFE